MVVQVDMLDSTEKATDLFLQEGDKEIRLFNSSHILSLIYQEEQKEGTVIEIFCSDKFKRGVKLL